MKMTTRLFEKTKGIRIMMLSCLLLAAGICLIAAAPTIACAGDDQIEHHENAWVEWIKISHRDAYKIAVECACPEGTDGKDYYFEIGKMNLDGDRSVEKSPVLSWYQTGRGWFIHRVEVDGPGAYYVSMAEDGTVIFDKLVFIRDTSSYGGRVVYDAQEDYIPPTFEELHGLPED